MNVEFNSGAKHGFQQSLFAVRNIDREISKNSNIAIYNAQKDLLHKIYAEIKKEMERSQISND